MQLSFWDLYSLFDKEYNSVIKEAAEKTGLTMNELGVLLFLSNNPSAKTASDIIRIMSLAVLADGLLDKKSRTPSSFIVKPVFSAASFITELYSLSNREYKSQNDSCICKSSF